MANAFFRAGEIESWGRGIEKMIATCRQAGYPDPGWHCGGAGLWVTFHLQGIGNKVADGTLTHDDKATNPSNKAENPSNKVENPSNRTSNKAENPSNKTQDLNFRKYLKTLYSIECQSRRCSVCVSCFAEGETKPAH